jgi:hypothetical protein
MKPPLWFECESPGPLQIQHYLTRILEQAHRFGEKPVTPTIVNATLAPDMHDLVIGLFINRYEFGRAI